MEHLMIDFETLGLRPTSIIIQMGVAAFDLDEKKIGKTMKMKFNIQEQLLTRTIDELTLKWWSKQDKELRKELIDENISSNSVKNIIPILNTFINENMSKNFKIWSRGHLEPTLIDSLIYQFKQKSKISYSRWRDIRTKVESKRLENPLKPHDALNDCINDINLLFAV